MESKDTAEWCSAISRLILEHGPITHMQLDNDSAGVKVMKEAEYNINHKGSLEKRKGFNFKAIPIGSHQQNHRVERRMRSFKELLGGLNLTKHRITILAFQNLLKHASSLINQTPFAAQMRNAAEPILTILTPEHFLRPKVSMTRGSLHGPITIPETASIYMENMDKHFENMKQIYERAIIPSLLPATKFHKETKPLEVGDVVLYPKFTTNPFDKQHKMGIIDKLDHSHDGKIRGVWVKYINVEQDAKTRDPRIAIKITDREARKMTVLPLMTKFDRDLKNIHTFFQQMNLIEDNDDAKLEEQGNIDEHMLHRTEKDEQNISQKKDEENPIKANQQVKTNQDTGSQPNPMTNPDINRNEIVQANVNNDQIDTTSKGEPDEEEIMMGNICFSNKTDLIIEGSFENTENENGIAEGINETEGRGGFYEIKKNIPKNTVRDERKVNSLAQGEKEQDLKIGYISRRKITHIIKEGAAQGANAMSFFYKEKKQWFSPQLLDEDIIEFKKDCLEYKIYPDFILPHGDLKANLGNEKNRTM